MDIQHLLNKQYGMEWNGMLWNSGQEAPSLHVNMFKEYSDVSILGSHWQPLSVHLQAHSNPLIAHDKNDA